MNAVETNLLEKCKQDVIMQAYDMRPTLLTTEKVMVEMDVKEKHLNYQGGFHGVLHFALGDITAGLLAHSDGGQYVSQSGGLNFMSNIGSGLVRAVATYLHHGRKTSVIKVEIFSEEGKLLSTGNYTLYCLKSSV